MSNFKYIKLLYETFIAGNDFTIPIRYQKQTTWQLEKKCMSMHNIIITL